MESVWTAELVQGLSTLWEEGQSAGEIGRRLGLTRNQVIGKAHRIGLAPRPSPLKKRPIKRMAPTIFRGGKAGECSWPVGHPGEADFGFCGKRTLLGKPYCAEHAARAHIRKEAVA